jgi:DHA1 family tetracycline resistance protein-like MFS transporter
MCVGVGMALVQGALVRVAVPRLGERRALFVGLLMSILGQAALGLANQGWMIYVLVFPLALGGLAGPAVQAIISRATGASEQGELQGSLNSLGGVAAIVGPLIGTNLLARFGPADASPHVPGAPFFAGAAIYLIGLLLAIPLFTRGAPETTGGLEVG